MVTNTVKLFWDKRGYGFIVNPKDPKGRVIEGQKVKFRLCSGKGRGSLAAQRIVLLKDEEDSDAGS